MEYYSPASCSLPLHVSLLCLSLRINNTVTPYSSAAVLAQHTVTISWLRYSLSLFVPVTTLFMDLASQRSIRLTTGGRNGLLTYQSRSVTWWKKNLKHYSTKTFLEFENEKLKLLKLTLEWSILIKWKYLNGLSNLNLRKIGIWIRSIQCLKEWNLDSYPKWYSAHPTFIEVAVSS